MYLQNDCILNRNCGDMGAGICGGDGSGEKIVYAWGRNAPELKLPPGMYNDMLSSLDGLKGHPFMPF